MNTSSVSDRTSQHQQQTINIANKLLDEAIWHHNKCTWTGDDLDMVDSEWQVIHQTLDPFYYSGVTGIADFLLQLWIKTNNDDYKNTATAALNQAVYLFDNNSLYQDNIGLYNGVIGIIITLLDAGSRFDNVDLIQKSHRLLEQTKTSIESNINNSYDIIDGYAGSLIGLLNLNKHYSLGLEKTCDLIACRLIKAATPIGAGKAWPCPNEADYLTGFAHGASGIAHALMEYYASTGDSSALETAKNAILFENGLFIPEKNNWASSISEYEMSISSNQILSTNWCHGAAGIGISRLRIYQLTSEPLYLRDVGAAIQACEFFMKNTNPGRKNYDHNMSLCHGIGSIIEFYLYAYQVLNNNYYFEQACQFADFGLQYSRTKADQWRIGVPGGRDSPALLTGIAGIAWNFLSLSEHGTLAPVTIASR